MKLLVVVTFLVVLVTVFWLIWLLLGYGGSGLPATQPFAGENGAPLLPKRDVGNLVISTVPSPVHESVLEIDTPPLIETATASQEVEAVLPAPTSTPVVAIVVETAPAGLNDDGVITADEFGTVFGWGPNVPTATPCAPPLMCAINQLSPEPTSWFEDAKQEECHPPMTCAGN